MNRVTSFIAAVLVCVAASAWASGPLVFVGTVRDAETNEPIAGATVLRGVTAGPGQPMVPLILEPATTDSAGQFRLEFAGKDPVFNGDRSLRFIRVEADGYAAATSSLHAGIDGDVALNIKLDRASPITGRVVDAAGNAVAHARVVLGTASCDAYVSLPSITAPPVPIPHGHEVATVSALDGTFTLPAQSDARVEVVATTADAGMGWALIDTDGETTIRLKPYGRLIGTVKFDGVAVPGTRVSVSSGQSPEDPNARQLIWLNADAIAADDGSYVVPCVPADEQLLVHVYKANRYIEGRAQVPSGETLTFSVGAGSASLHGSVQIPDEPVAYSLRLTRVADPIDLPENWNDLEVRRAWWNGPAITPKGQAQMRIGASYMQEVEARPDGAFELLHLDDGFWALDVRAMSAETGFFASRTFHFTVRDGKPNVDRIEPLPLEVSRQASVRPGAPMPEINATNADGSKFEWSQYRGKVVLVDVWGPWCGPCRGDTPALKLIHERYALRSDFTILGLSVDDRLEAVQEYMKEQRCHWPNAHMGDHQTGRPEAKKLGIVGYPTYLLVDREGRLIEYTSPARVIATLDALLGQEQSQDPKPR